MEIFITILIFSIFDFFGYNLSKRYGLVDENFINPYRILQAGVQIGITTYLLLHYNFIIALSFNILWWTFVADWIYYILCLPFGFLFNISTGYKEPFQNKVRHAWWTVFGLIQLLFFGKEPSKIIIRDSIGNVTTSVRSYRILKWQYLLLQSIIGIVTVILINS